MPKRSRRVVSDAAFWPAYFPSRVHGRHQFGAVSKAHSRTALLRSSAHYLDVPFPPYGATYLWQDFNFDVLLCALTPMAEDYSVAASANNLSVPSSEPLPSGIPDINQRPFIESMAKLYGSIPRPILLGCPYAAFHCDQCHEVSHFSIDLSLGCEKEARGSGAGSSTYRSRQPESLAQVAHQVSGILQAL